MAAIASALLKLAPNTALDLGSLFPTLTIPKGESQNQTAQIYGNAGCAYDATRKQVAYFGGGHAGTNYDSVVRLQLTDLAFVQDYPPTNAQPDMVLSNYDRGRGCWLAGTSGPYPRPAARHTVSQILVWQNELIVFGLVEGNGPNTQQGVDTGMPQNTYIFNAKAQIARYSLPDKTWTFENAAPTQTDGDGGVAQWGAVAYDPPSGLILWVSANSFYTYDPVMRVKKKWIAWSSPTGQLVDETGARVRNTLGINGTLCYNAVEDKHYWFCRNTFEVWRLDLDRRNQANAKMVRLAVSGTPPSSTSGEQPVRYDSANNVFGTGPWDNVFYVFDSAAKKWSKQTIVGNVGSVATLSHMLVYAPDANVYVLMTDQNNAPSRSHLWAYRWA